MLPGVIDTPEVRKIHARIFELEMSPEFRRWGSLDPDHDLTFIRRCAHLCARAEQKGYKLLFRDVVTGGVMPFLAWKRYFEILAGEAASMSRASFAEIEKMPVPAELERLWRDDVEYHSRIGTGRTYE
jgi:hypothetical protein